MTADVDNSQVITILSLCAGYGGIELGLSRVLANPMRVIAVEIEAFALANLVAKAEESKLAIEALWPDVRTFPAERFRGCFDFVTAGYPCQPFSVAGKRKGEKDPRHLWPAIARIVQAVEPIWCFFENVPGHLTLGFSSVYRSLRDMGYYVEAGLFTAAECELDIESKRLFILASSDRNGCKYVCCKKQSKIIKSGPILLQGRGQQPVKRLGSSFFSKESNEWESKTRFCRAIDGTRNRVDRLRLVGNGVVPQQAELAFRYLYEKVTDDTGRV